VPVINGLTNEYHPCQILADIFTFIEHRGSIQGKTVAWVGDSNNMCNTWLQAAEVLGFNVHVSTPPAMKSSPSAPTCTAPTISRALPTRWTPAAAPIW
jgi:ornithine carbamoyltransferase